MTSPYPEYEELLNRARSATPMFVSPQDLARYQGLASERGSDWCSAVLGRPFQGIRAVSVVECQLLVLADAEGLVPPLPAAMVEARARRAAAEKELAERRQRLEDADRDRWREAMSKCGVELEVRENTRGRRTGTGGLAAGPLRHAVPVVDVASGTTSRPRLHVAGRAVCETVQRARPRQLGDPVEAPVTCVSCLKLVPKLRAR